MLSRNKKSIIGIILCLAACILFSLMDQTVSLLQKEGYDTFFLVAARYQICGIAAIFIVFRYREALKKLLKDKLHIILIIIYSIIGIITQAWLYGQTILNSSAPFTFIIDKVSIIIMIIITCFMMKRKPFKSEYIGVLLCAAGLIIILTQGFTFEGMQLNNLALVYGTLLIFNQVVTNMLPEKIQKTYSAAFVLAVSMAITALITLPAAQLWNPPVEYNLYNIVLLLFLGLGSTLLGIYCFNKAIDFLGAIKATLIGAIQLPITAIMSAILGLYTITLPDVIGGVFIVAMIVVCTKPTKEKTEVAIAAKTDEPVSYELSGKQIKQPQQI